jgi:hypothetical protein
LQPATLNIAPATVMVQRVDCRQDLTEQRTRHHACTTTLPNGGCARLRSCGRTTGSLEGGRRAAIIYTLVGTAELNGWDPQTYLRALLDCIADHRTNRISELARRNLRPDTI